MSVSISNITKRYGEQLALDGVSLEVGKGEVTGLIGPNGAGKSTLMKIITGFLSPTSGEVTVDGMDVVEHSLEVRRIIGYLPEHNPLYRDMYVREYLQYVAGLYGMGRSGPSRVNRVIEQTGLTVEMKKKIGALSKGYRQRVGLAQALLHDPRVMILDEPTSGLDPNQVVEIRDLIRASGRDKTIILSTHIMQEVEAICSRVVIINKGKIVADDPSNALKTGLSKGFQTIIVEFDSQVSRDKLGKLSQANRVMNVSGNNWLIQTGSQHDIRADVFEFAVREGLKVLSMQKQEQSLEEVFRQLTGGSPSGPSEANGRTGA